MLIAVTRIPARTTFHLVAPACDTRLTLDNAARSMTKVPHMVLFGLFALITAAQFNRFDRRTLYWSVVAAAALGLIVELEEGATRTGNCRITDVLPDIVGALAVLAPLAVAIASIRAARANPRS
jgi:4-amino-4-deoxy-L-arabinose transferase-like glycosyltransferase